MVTRGLPFIVDYVKGGGANDVNGAVGHFRINGYGQFNQYYLVCSYVAKSLEPDEWVRLQLLGGDFRTTTSVRRHDCGYI